MSLTLVASACGSDGDEATTDSLVETEAESVDESVPADEADESTDEAATDETETETEAEPADETEAETSGVAIQENGPVEVTGDALTEFDSTVPDETVGTPAPVITGQDFDGTPVTLGGPTENPTMIVFLAHWCPHCNDEIPELISLDDAGSIPDGLDVIGVSTAVDPGASNYPPSEWIVEKGWPWATMADDEQLSAIAAMGGNSFPFTVILDTDGNVLARRGGSATAEASLEFINSALG